jgi:hypothetical protein
LSFPFGPSEYEVNQELSEILRHGSARHKVSDPGRAAAARFLRGDEVIDFLRPPRKCFRYETSLSRNVVTAGCGD